MCAGIEFEGRRILFSDENPQLPVLLKDGKIGWAVWGRPFKFPDAYPAGGWARLDSIKSGRWKRWKPKPVKIPATAFMERAKDGRAVWFPIAGSLVIQGCAITVPNKIMIAERGRELVRVYVVTEPALGDVALVHDRQPRLVPRHQQP